MMPAGRAQEQVPYRGTVRKSDSKVFAHAIDAKNATSLGAHTKILSQ